MIYEFEYDKIGNVIIDIRGGQMFIEDFILKGGLNKNQIDLMNEKAMYLIKNVGINIPHEGILELL